MLIGAEIAVPSPIPQATKRNRVPSQKKLEMDKFFYRMHLLSFLLLS
jgi:hypothetical protein